MRLTIGKLTIQLNFSRTKPQSGIWWERYVNGDVSHGLALTRRGFTTTWID